MSVIVLTHGFVAKISEEDEELTNAHWFCLNPKTRKRCAYSTSYWKVDEGYPKNGILLQRAVARRMLQRELEEWEKCSPLNHDALDCTRGNILVIRKTIIGANILIDEEDREILEESGWYVHHVSVGATIRKAEKDGVSRTLHRRIMERITKGALPQSVYVSCYDENFLNVRRDNLFIKTERRAR